MARIGGRNSWVAVPAGLLCLAVVAGLVYLALPMLPVSLLWAGDTLRAATTEREAPPAADPPALLALADGSIDCRTLYPDSVWAELTWRGGALLTQRVGEPATAVTALSDALAPIVIVTCAWALEEDGGIVTTLASVGEDAASIADASLRGQGFACTSDDGALRCTRTRGDVLEEHTMRGGLWLSSSQNGWRPEEYGARLEAHVWG